MKKKLENIWYYYKTIIVLALIILAAVIFVLLQNAGKTAPAEQVAIVSADAYPDDSIKALEKAFSDLYGHEVKVRLYQVELGADNQDSAVIGALDADLVANISSTFLLENVASFQEATNHLPITEPVPVSETDGIKDLGFNELYLVRRLPSK